MIRSFYRHAGTNPEIEGSYYELCSSVCIVGHCNLLPLTLGFQKGASIQSVAFAPIDAHKPVVLAVDDEEEIGFIFLDGNGENNSVAGLYNSRAHKSNTFLIDCNRFEGPGGMHRYWSLMSGGSSFVYGDVISPGVWGVRNADHLCAFVAGELTASQLKMHAYFFSDDS